jgi:hypothetical protein
MFLYSNWHWKKTTFFVCVCVAKKKGSKKLLQHVVLKKHQNFKSGNLGKTNNKKHHFRKFFLSAPPFIWEVTWEKVVRWDGS